MITSNNPQIQQLWVAASAEGLLPADAQPPQPVASRPWPVVLMTGLGAWMVALCLLVLLGLLLHELLRGAGAVLLGALLLGGATLLLREDAAKTGAAADSSGALFVQQLALAGLLAGFCLLAFGFAEGLKLSYKLWMGLLLALALFLLRLLPQVWLRVLLGAGAALLFLLMVQPGHEPLDGLGHGGGLALIASLHLGVLAWLLMLLVQQRLLRGGPLAGHAAALESLALGWLLLCLAGLALGSGTAFLLAGNRGVGELAEIHSLFYGRPAGGGFLQFWPLLSSLLSLLSAAWLLRAWPQLRRAWWMLAALGLAALAYFNPWLGAAQLALAVCAASGRWRLAAAAGLACVWMISAFYYQLSWPLADKALVLVAVGALLAVVAWWAQRAEAAASPAGPGLALALAASPSARRAWLGVGVGVLLTLAVANGGIWQKERLIAQGRPILVPLAPVDPRSLMQGDFMALNLQVGRADLAGRSEAMVDLSSEQPRLILRLDERGVAVAQRPDAGGALAADELRLQLVLKNGRWILVTDAFYFKEGEAERYAQARFGEFRVDADGRALLVGLRGADLQPL
ncbi:putative membrane-anchored protein [Paucibacter oligotrophus]|uniref:Putative membrane-anchored protein n=1 Tax=Roseateles oligotrophus TaxID=1769250 RepID=A0A840L493_9BURK|nr:GDYXXLXY domain-containing protein [Roseateles oligotrophus]MBB4843354.1 putative membrane-anchored protein [Roseateles oligotrophus]